MIIIILTFAASGLLAWGFWHEEKFIEFEQAAWKAIKKAIKRRFGK